VAVIADAVLGPIVPAGLGGIGSTAAFALAVVWVMAAVAKLRSPSATSAGMRELAVPAPRLLARIVPLLELAAAAALLAEPQLGAVLSLALLAPFTAVAVRSIRSGRPATCGCFGSWSRDPVSLATVARNAALAAVALAAGTVPVLARPDLASALAGGLALLVVTVGVELLRLRLAIGRIWSVRLAGEPVPARQPGRTPS
jgi:uncharacterized membrane protein YphA (DoxX/SURF4 family)